MTTETMATAVAVPIPLTEEQIKGQMTMAVTKGDWGTVKRLASELDKLAKAEQAKAKADLSAKLTATGDLVKGLIGHVVHFLTCGTKPDEDGIKTFVKQIRLLTGKELDGAEGVWYAKDFGQTDIAGTAIRLVKTAKKASSAGNGGSASSYVSDPRKSSDLLAVIGDVAMFAEATTVTIDKTAHTMPAGMTLRQAYNFSSNGGWRNRVRAQLLKAANKIA